MPQARSGGSGSSGGSRAKSSARKTRAGSSAAKRSSSGSTRSRPARSTARASSSSSKSADARVEAVAKRLRTLNERIIEAGKEAGETTLSNYEKALKAIASTIERGPGSSDIEWVSHLATAQAKFLRDVTSSLTSAARDRLK
jgi:hypothetical protein